ncbi:hypothetical protein D3C86_1263510 [compost metagenome]
MRRLPQRHRAGHAGAALERVQRAQHQAALLRLFGRGFPGAHQLAEFRQAAVRLFQEDVDQIGIQRRGVERCFGRGRRRRRRLRGDMGDGHLLMTRIGARRRGHGDDHGVVQRRHRRHRGQRGRGHRRQRGDRRQPGRRIGHGRQCRGRRGRLGHRRKRRQRRGLQDLGIAEQLRDGAFQVRLRLFARHGGARAHQRAFAEIVQVAAQRRVGIGPDPGGKLVQHRAQPLHGLVEQAEVARMHHHGVTAQQQQQLFEGLGDVAHRLQPHRGGAALQRMRHAQRQLARARMVLVLPLGQVGGELAHQIVGLLQVDVVERQPDAHRANHLVVVVVAGQPARKAERQHVAVLGLGRRLLRGDRLRRGGLPGRVGLGVGQQGVQ